MLVDYEAVAKRIAARRMANPEREVRRQAELSRMARRVDYVPTYRPLLNGGQEYTGHVAVAKR